MRRLQRSGVLAAVVAAGLVGLSAQVPVPMGPAPGGQAPVQGAAPGTARGPLTGTGFIAGQVVEAKTGAGLDGVMVQMSMFGAQPGRGTGFPVRQVLTDSRGRFYFDNLPKGSFAVQVDAPNYQSIGASFSRAHELGDGEHITDLKIKLLKFATLSGVVRDESGDPVVGMTVRAFRRGFVNGRRAFQGFVAVTKTDDRGMYRVAGLQPGDYAVLASSMDPIPFDGTLLKTMGADPALLMGLAARALTVGADVVSLDGSLRTFAPAFYPNTATAARATILALGSGDEKSGVDIDVASVRYVRVSGRITNPPGPVTANDIRLVPAGESSEGAVINSLPPMLVQPDGRFDFAGVPPGQYVLSVSCIPRAVGAGTAPTGAALQFIGGRGAGPVQMGATMSGGPAPTGDPMMWSSDQVTVGDNGASGLSIGLRRALTIDGRFEFAGAAQPPQAQMLQRAGSVVLAPLDPRAQGPVPVGAVKPDATFQITNALPGQYVIRGGSFPNWPTLKSVMMGANDITDLPLTIESADLGGLVITYSDQPLGSLSGTLQGGPDPNGPELTALVFPVDRKYWADPAAASRRYRAAPLSRAGNYTFPQGFPAGEYFVAVVTDEGAIDWLEPGRFESLSRTALRVTIADGDKKILDVKR